MEGGHVDIEQLQALREGACEGTEAAEFYSMTTKIVIAVIYIPVFLVGVVGNLSFHACNGVDNVSDTFKQYLHHLCFQALQRASCF